MFAHHEQPQRNIDTAEKLQYRTTPVFFGYTTNPYYIFGR